MTPELRWALERYCVAFDSKLDPIALVDEYERLVEYVGNETETSRIVELEDEIARLEDLVADLDSTNDDLREEIRELEEKLSVLENERTS